MVTINIRFLGKLFGGIVACGLIVIGLHWWQAKRIPNTLLQQIDLATADGNSDLAIRHLRQYLEFRPDDLEARADLAGRLKERGSTAELAFLYDQILRHDPSLAEIRRDAMTLAAKQHRYTDAADHAQKLLESQPNDGTVWRILADARAALNLTEEAVAAYEKAVTHQTDDPSAYTEYVMWLWTEANRSAQASTVADRFVAAFPDRPEPYVLRARMRMADNELARPDVIADLDRALKNTPDDADALILSADWFQRAGEYSVARERLVAGLATHPRDIRFPRRLAWLDLHRGNPIEALRTLETGLQTVEKGAEDLLIPFGDLLIQLGERKRAEAIVARLEANPQKKARVQAQYLNARLAMQAGDWTKSIELLSDLRTSVIDLPGLVQQANLLLAIAFRQTANIPAERDALMLVLNHDPKHVPARVALAQSYLAAGDFQAGLREFDEAARSPHASGATAAMPIRLRANRLAMSPNPSAAEWTEIDRLTTLLTQRFPKEAAEASMLQADLLSLRGELAKAIALLRQEIGRRPGDRRLWSALAALSGRAMGVSAGLAVCEEGIAIAGDGPELRIAKANLFALDPLGSYPFDSLDRGIDTWTDLDQSRLISGLIDAADRADRGDTVVRLSHRLAARRASEPSAWLSVAELAIPIDDRSATASARAQLVRIEGESGPNVVVLDSLLLTNREKLFSVFGPEPFRSDVCRLLARTETNPEKANFWLIRALTIDPANVSIVREAIDIWARHGQSDAIASLVGRLNLDPRWHGEPLRRVVLRSLTFRNASMVMTGVRSLHDRSHEASVWWSHMLQKAGRPTEAVQLLSDLANRPMTNGDDYLRLVKANPDQAEATLTAAKSKLPNRAYHSLAAAWSNSGHAVPSDEPFSRLQAIVQDHMARGRPMEAIRALSAPGSLSPAETIWIVKSRCVLLAAHGNNSERRQAAVDLMRLTKDLKTEDDRRTVAATMVGLHRYLDGDIRDRLLSQAAALINPSKSPRDCFLVFQIERARGDGASRERARAVLNELLKSDPTNLDYLLAGLEELTEAQAVNLTGPFVTALSAHHSSEYRVIAALARHECVAGRADRVVPLVETWARSVEKQRGLAEYRALRAADLLDECARRPDVKGTPHAKMIVDAARVRYAGLLPARLEALPAAVSLLSAFGRTDEAVSLVERYAAVIPNRIRAASGVAMLRSGTVTDRLKSIARTWLDAAIADEPMATGIRLNEGEFFALTGDRAKAEQTFRSVLAFDPQNTVALNNLAWILAAEPAQSDSALSLVDRASRESGLTPELLDTRARIHLAAKRTDLAEHDLQAALAQDKTALRLFHLAMAKRNANRIDDAKVMFQQAIDRGLEPNMIHPDDRSTYRIWLASGVQ
jgi:tetratricopeptide (TPR) repeat protein